MKVGVHLPNDGRMSGEDLALAQDLALVKGLVRLYPGTVRALASARALAEFGA